MILLFFGKRDVQPGASLQRKSHTFRETILQKQIIGLEAAEIKHDRARNKAWIRRRFVGALGKAPQRAI